MFRRAKNFLADVLQQADMILLALCCAATLFGITMVYSATRYMQTNRLVIIQGCALVLGVVLYLLVSMVDLSEVVKKWKWLTMFNFGFILLLLTPFGRSDGTGNRAWLKFPGFPVSIQPARAGVSARLAQGAPRPQERPVGRDAGRPSAGARRHLL